MSAGNNIQANPAKQVKQAKQVNEPTPATGKVPGDRPPAGPLVSTAKGSLAKPDHSIMGRPIGPSAVQVTHTLYGNRPVGASNLQVDHTLAASGIRPVAASALTVSKRGYIMKRPIAVSQLQVSEGNYIFGNRPIAANEVGETETLMGFLD